MIRRVEAHTDFVDMGATDFGRADPIQDSILSVGRSDTPRKLP